MELQQIQRATEQTDSRTELAVPLPTSKNLADNEIFKLKYSARPAGMLSVEDLRKTVIASLARCCIITGWLLPSDDSTRMILYNEFSLLLTEQYATVNQEEIAYSMRKYGTRIKDWGKNINLSLIAEALDAYLSERREISRMEEFVPKEKLKSLPPAEVDWSEIWEDLKSGKVKIIPSPVYGWLRKKELLKKPAKEELEKFKRLASQSLTAGLEDLKIPVSQKKELREKYRDMNSVEVINEAKKIAVRQLIEQLK